MTTETRNQNRSILIRGLVEHEPEWLSRIRADTPDRLRNLLPAEDIFQESCLAVWQQTASPHPEMTEGDVRMLTRTVDSKRISAQRNLAARKRGERACGSRNHDPAVERVSSEPSSSEECIRHDEATSLHEHVSALPSLEGQAVTLKFFQGLSNAQIAIQLRCSCGAVHGRLCRAMAALRVSLAATNDAHLDTFKASRKSRGGGGGSQKR